MSRKLFTVMTVLWALFALFIIVTDGPWWLAAMAAVMAGLNFARLRTLLTRQS